MRWARQITTYTGTVQLLASDLQATGPMPYVFMPQDQGFASVGSLTLRSLGTTTLMASDGTRQSPKVMVEVMAGSAEGLVVQTAATAIAGAPVDINLSVVDDLGNVSPQLCWHAAAGRGRRAGAFASLCGFCSQRRGQQDVTRRSGMGELR